MRKKRELSMKEPQKLWALLGPAPSLSGTVHKPFRLLLCLSENYSPFCLEPWVKQVTNGRRTGVHEDACLGLSSFWSH